MVQDSYEKYHIVLEWYKIQMRSIVLEWYKIQNKTSFR